MDVVYSRRGPVVAAAVVAVGAFGVGGPVRSARAQSPTPNAVRNESQSRWRQRDFLSVVRGLDLSAAQRSAIEARITAWRVEQANVPAGPERDQSRWAITYQMHNEVSGVLTRAQRDTLRAELEKGRLAGGILDDVFAPITLTDAQKDRLDPILRALGRELGRLKGDRSLSKMERGRRARAAFAATFAQINPLLTPTQRDRVARSPLWRSVRGEG